MFTRLRSTLAALIRRDHFEQEMAEELRFHMSAYSADLVRSGVTPEEAERRARLEFGAVESFREECRQARGLRVFDELRQDIRYAVRQMARAPGFSAAVVVSLALGIGANTAIFSLMDAVLFRTLPVGNPESLYFLAHRFATDSTTSSNYPLFERYKAVDAFSGVTAFSQQTFDVSTADGRERVDGQYVSGNYHAVLDVPIALGRGFSSESDRPSGQSAIAVISDDYWNRKFARNPNAIGQTLTIGGRVVTIVGITEPGFHGLIPGWRLDITLPIALRVLGNPEFLVARDGWTSLSLVARLKPGATEAQALAAADAVFRPFWMEPENAWARRDKRSTARSAALVRAGRGSLDLRTRYARPLGVLMAMVGVVLLIACANVANLLLARATVRAREVAIRLSIGAGRARLVRQFLTESLLYAIIGGLLGILVSFASTAAVVSLFDIGEMPIRLDVEVDGRVLAFTIVVSMLAGVVFGVLPSLAATRVDLTRDLKEGAVVRHGRRQAATGKVLVVAQVALCVLVIAVASLLVQTLRNLRSFDAGFERDNILLFNLGTRGAAITPEQRTALYGEVRSRLAGLPGVTAVAMSSRSPIDFSAQLRGISVPGFQGKDEGASAYVVTPEYFPLFGIRVLRGRGFTDQDRAGRQPVALINERMARTYFGSSDPIGRTFRFLSEKELATIVGIVEDVRHEQLREASPPTVYTVIGQPATGLDGTAEVLHQVTVEVRSRNDPRSLVAAVRNEVRALHPDAIVWYTRTMHQQLDAALIRERLLASLSTGFGLLALLLAFVGLYGVMSYRVARRGREIGVRMALGATRGLVLRQIVRETMKLAGVGTLLGLAAALAATSVVSSFLFGLSPHDPVMFAAVVAMLMATALVAGFLPARRAASIDPMRALRAE